MKTYNKEFRFDLDIDTETLNITADVDVFLDYDSEYGADADGYRGKATTFIEGFDINSLVVLSESGKSVKVDKELKKIINNEIEEMLVNFEYN